MRCPEAPRASHRQAHARRHTNERSRRKPHHTHAYAEYGAHWNFFFTLALAQMAGSMLSAADARVTALRGALTLSAHQLALNSGLGEWVRTAPRINLLSANKEGVSSLSGYGALYLFGDAAGALLLPKPHAHHWWHALAQLLGIDLFLWIAASLSEHFLAEAASRQLCNMPYALWVSAQFVLVLCVCLLGCIMWPQARTPPVLDRIAKRPLATFLLANLLTGAVNLVFSNLSISTMHASHALASAILMVYMGVLVVCAHFQLT